MDAPPHSQRAHYGKLVGLKDVYLEDSYVLGIGEDPGLLRFTVQVVLREGHPAYQAPERPARYCYRLGVLEFRNVTKVEWARKTLRKYRDADGRVDFGNIDVFYREGATYHLEGDWGVVDVASAPPIVRLMM